MRERLPICMRTPHSSAGSTRSTGAAGATAGLWNREVFSRELYDFGMIPGILELAESILGPEIQFNGDYWVRSKLPHESLTTYPWHQDSGYYGAATEKHHILSLWIPLVDVDEVNGCLQMMPGSHRWGLLPTMSDGGGHLQPREDIEERGRVRGGHHGGGRRSGLPQPHVPPLHHEPFPTPSAGASIFATVPSECRWSGCSGIASMGSSPAAGPIRARSTPGRAGATSAPPRPRPHSLAPPRTPDSRYRCKTTRKHQPEYVSSGATGCPMPRIRFSTPPTTGTAR